MNKIAAYEIALQQVELEKKAEFIIDNFGSFDGKMPAAYVAAFDEMMEKEAVLEAIGKGVTGLIYRGAKALGGTGASGARTGIRGGAMDWASGLGGKSNSGAFRARTGQIGKNLTDAGFENVTEATINQGRSNALKMLGGATVAGGLGGAYMLGRPSGN
jgi:hypothetical protein